MRSPAIRLLELFARNEPSRIGATDGDLVAQDQGMRIEHFAATESWHAPCCARRIMTRKSRPLPPRDARGRFTKVRRAATRIPVSQPDTRQLYTVEDVARACACAVDRALARRVATRSHVRHWVALVVVPFGLLAWMVLS